MNVNHLKKTLLFSFFIGLVQVGHAQNSNDAREVTQKLFIKNATVIKSPTSTLKGTSILIEDGLIKQMGTGIQAPYDAKIIVADSMYVYAGFIDAASHTGLAKKEESNDRERVANPGYPPNDVAGITPDIKVSTLIDMEQKSITEMRKNGITLSHVIPQGRMLPGQGSILSLGKGHRDHMLVKQDVSMFSQFSTARGVAPGTLIGVISKWRDLYHNASHVRDYQTKTRASQSGMPRATIDKETAALIPVTQKQMPVFFKAEKVLNIHRVLKLQKELGFDLVLTEVKQAYPILDKIAASRTKVLLSLDLPKEDKKKDKKDDDEKIDPEKEALNKRKMEAQKSYLTQAAMMEKKGVKFGFSFLESKAKDLKSSIRRLIENGLSESAALAALTTNPAEMLGISSMAGTVDQGKMAHLILTDKPYFEEKSNIRYVIVDGQQYEFEVKEKKKKKKTGDGDGGDGDEIGDITGKWTYELEIPGQTRGGNLIIEKEDDDYIVKISNDEAPDDYEDCNNVTIDGTNLTFSFNVNEGGMSMDLTFDLEIEGDSFEGSIIAGQFGSFPATGSKVDPK